ncbi:LacI family DNA-binding transcriptional regulator [Pullulanibacillus sp. KACC 23026]|uniref:LacI family DNA-binding transcriptional regulator n=1 Tax=Pullulanibacillus sp. KACC 23026 TaxID=3028315 RepID=UPI0023AFA09B|nr:LacI family DNA-binding transcriptional regulator [Pullulanibacillus sp. KACC 23026]WEG13177.1 LacI family DNA-binding transcriptional regulator [Pullulanibacillus sp. KACC 23026]
MAVTIKDVAKLANVNPSTVSRVIANSSRISEKTKRTVREAMEQLGYYPNHHARSLANQSAQTIGIVLPGSGGELFQNPFFPQVIQGISKEAHANHYGIYMTTGITKEEIRAEVLSMVHGRRVDGLILLYSRIGDELVDLLIKLRFPFVLIGKPYINENQITHVDNDNIQAAIEATQYLINLGHTKCAFIGGAPELVVTTDRLNGYKQALTQAGLPIRDEYIVHQDFLQEGGRQAGQLLMSMEDPPTGLIVADDIMALGIMSSLTEISVRVPEDISLISFNNLLISEYCSPPLTSVEINIFQLGSSATDALFQLIKETELPTNRFIIPHEIIERASCAPPKTK